MRGKRGTSARWGGRWGAGQGAGASASEELDDLVEIIVGRLEGTGLTVMQRPTPQALAPERENVELMFKRAAWLG